MKCKHENCPESSLSLADHCWEHLQNKETFIERLLSKAVTDGDMSGYNLKKIVLKKARLEKVDMSKCDLSQSNFSGTYFFDSKFTDADLIGSDLSQCDLTHCDLKRADLTKATLDHARLWSSDLESANLTEADLTEADLWDAKLFNTKLWHTLLTGAKSIFMKSFSPGKKYFDDPRINEGGSASAEQAYRTLKQYFMEKGKYGDASWASFKEKTMERMTFLKNRNPSYIPSLIMNILCGYGEKPYRIVLSAFSTIVIFSLLYAFIGAARSAYAGDPSLGWADYLYYSTITFTTVGYGDIVPKPVSQFRLLAASEAFIGVYLTGLFVFTLARKYSAR